MFYRFTESRATRPHVRRLSETNEEEHECSEQGENLFQISKGKPKR